LEVRPRSRVAPVQRHWAEPPHERSDGRMLRRTANIPSRRYVVFPTATRHGRAARRPPPGTGPDRSCSRHNPPARTSTHTGSARAKQARTCGGACLVPVGPSSVRGAISSVRSRNGFGPGCRPRGRRAPGPTLRGPMPRVTEWSAPRRIMSTHDPSPARPPRCAGLSPAGVGWGSPHALHVPASKPPLPCSGPAEHDRPGSPVELLPQLDIRGVRSVPFAPDTSGWIPGRHLSGEGQAGPTPIAVGELAVAGTARIARGGMRPIARAPEGVVDASERAARLSNDVRTALIGCDERRAPSRRGRE